MKKIILLAPLIIVATGYCSEFTQSSKPFVNLSDYLPATDNPMSIEQLVSLIKELEKTSHSDLQEEIDRNFQLAHHYERLCARLTQRGKKAAYDKFRGYAEECRKKALELTEAELTRLDNEIYTILNDEKRGQKPYRWVAVRPHYQRMAALAFQDPELHKKTLDTLSYINDIKQPVVDQLELLKKFKAADNKVGMITCYQTLLTLTESSISRGEIQSRIMDLENEVKEEIALTTVQATVDKMLEDKGSDSDAAHYEKIVDFCNCTLKETDFARVTAFCKSNRYKYTRLQIIEEINTTPTVGNDEFVRTACRSMAYNATLPDLVDIRKMVKEIAADAALNECADSIFTHDYIAQEASTATEESVATLTKTGASARTQTTLERLHDKMVETQSKKILDAAHKSQTGKAEDIVELANAYFHRAQFYKTYCPERSAAKIKADLAKAKDHGLRAFGKNQESCKQLLFTL